MIVLDGTSGEVWIGGGADDTSAHLHFRGDTLRIGGGHPDGGDGKLTLQNADHDDRIVLDASNSGSGIQSEAANGQGVKGTRLWLSTGKQELDKNIDEPKYRGVSGLVESGAGVLGMSNRVSVLGLVNPGGWEYASKPGMLNSKHSIGVCGAFPWQYPADKNGNEAPLPWEIDFVNHLLSDPLVVEIKDEVKEETTHHIGVYGMAQIGVLATTPFGGGYGLVACNTKFNTDASGRHYSAAFYGPVKLVGDLELTGKVQGQVQAPGGDCAECFDLASGCEADPGSVMSIDDDGRLSLSSQEYDRKVAGVVSGAGDYQPGIVLAGGHKASVADQVQIALIGRVNCKVDASFAPIAVGDLLTTSLTPGHAMKATDPDRAFGAVIGKALRPLREGQGLIPVLVALR
jgi:hypothetical protein